MTAREYVRLYSALAISPKWGVLTWEERGVWTSLLAYCGLRNEPSFTIEEAAFHLRTDRERLEPILESLVLHGWLDRLDDGRLEMHDWTDWQPVYRGPSDAPDAKRRRRREQTERDRASRANGAIEERRGEEKREEDSRAGAHEPSTIEPSRDGIAAYLRNLWRHAATDPQLRILEEIADRQRTSERSGWTWILETMKARPAGVDPLEHAMAEDRRLSNERLARADARDAAWNETKRRERERTGAAQI